MKFLDKFLKKDEPHNEETSSPIIPEHKTIPVLMPDGTIEEYDEHFIITDGRNCVSCLGEFYHTSFDCENLKWEISRKQPPLQGMLIADAKKQKMTYCYNCSRDLHEYRKLME